MDDTMNMGEGGMDGGDPMESRNPFALPSDEEVFRMRDEERHRKQAERERLAKLQVWEKTTASSTMGATKRLKDPSADAALVGKQPKSTRGLIAAATAVTSGDRRREKENMADFISKKREMFLVQMSLDTKREEIRKLEEKAQMKEEALKKSELMLEEDAIRFDTFLKENDKEAHKAIKRAETETKAKTDKVQEIKKLNSQIQAIQSDMSKSKEQLEDCLKHKEFLDSLTAAEYFEEQRALKLKRQKERQAKRNEARMQHWEEACAKAVAEAEARERAEQELLELEGRVAKKKKDKEPEVHLPPKPDLSLNDLTSSGEELSMCFSKNTQLLDIFTALEEQNLFLIQNSQETEQALEELRQQYRETKRKMDAKTATLQQNISRLRHQIQVEDNKATELKSRALSRAGDSKQKDLIAQIEEKVQDVYKRCGFDADSKPTTLFMLNELEAKLEKLLSQIAVMPDEEKLKAMKEKEKERRERVRKERMDQQQKMYEERMKKSMQRSMQAPKKRKGRQVMWRSQPLRKAVQAEKKNDDGAEDDEDAQYFT
jgi:hypothetical protein